MMEYISWTESVKHEEVLHRVKEERNIIGKFKEERLTGLVIPCVATVFQNTLLEERQDR
jgi:hypothetical protein